MEAALWSRGREPRRGTGADEPASSRASRLIPSRPGSRTAAGQAGPPAAARPFRRGLEIFLEAAVLLLLAALALAVVAGVTFRKAGASLVWYDEVSSILLAWLTYYGAAFAALKRAHIGVPTLMNRLRGRARLAAVCLSEAFVLAFFLVVAWAGWRVLAVVGGTSLVSLPWVPVRLTQSVIPIGAVLFVLAELSSLPGVLSGRERDS